MAFYVIGEDNQASWSAKTDGAERFASRKAAEKRARDLASSMPGERFEIVQTVAEVSCPVGAPKLVERG
jgi:hypothetical protein